MSNLNLIYEDLKICSGTYTNISNVSKNLTGHDIYGSYHFENFTKTNALRNTLTSFNEFLVPYDLSSKKVFDIGSCLGALSFECIRR